MHICVHHDAHRTPLQCTYDGPFKVFEQAAKFFTLDLNGQRDTVSVDRLKPAFLDADWGLGESWISNFHKGKAGATYSLIHIRGNTTAPGQVTYPTPHREKK